MLAKVDARAALRSSSDLSRVQVKRLDAKTGKPVLLNVDASAAPAETLWLRDGDVIELTGEALTKLARLRPPRVAFRQTGSRGKLRVALFVHALRTGRPRSGAPAR